MRWSILKSLKLWSKQQGFGKVVSSNTLRRMYSSSGDKKQWTSQEIRQTFLDFFIKEHQHQYVHSSSILPSKTDGTFFVNAGMNQFKPIFLGTLPPDSELATLKRVANSQKCIRVGGKHNDLDDVGRDLYHHTFFEMMGNWSFADYFKEEACTMAWDLLTNVYGLPKDCLYVTYFGGDETLGLPPDTECRDIWMEIGVPSSRIHPFGVKDNFWTMGDTGPCGACTEIHLDHVGNRDASALINADSPEVVELWNVVFMQYNRHKSGHLTPLPRCHIDTGLGLERLTAALQGKISNYDTDLFVPLFQEIQRRCNIPAYGVQVGSSDKDGIDTAYRIVADHMRMMTVCLGDGLAPGRSNRYSAKLQAIMYRCMNQARNVLNAPPGMLGGLVDVVVDSLGKAFPELTTNPKLIAEVINKTEEQYMKGIEENTKMFDRMVAKNTDTKCLSGDQMYWLSYVGTGARAVPVDLMFELAKMRGVELDMDGFERRIQEEQEKMALSSQSDEITVSETDLLNGSGIPHTDDSAKYIYERNNGEYSFPSISSRVCGIVRDGKLLSETPEGEECYVVLDRTCFYAESGGQAADIGVLTTQAGHQFKVDHVKAVGNYIIHKGKMMSGHLKVTDQVELSIDQPHRVFCMRNHTATHLLNFALRAVLGDDVRQQGSSVTAERLFFQFSSLRSLSLSDLREVEQICNELILSGAPVYRTQMSFEQAKQIQGLRYLEHVTYPGITRVLSIGTPVNEETELDVGLGCSVELCGGTHVANCHDIGCMVTVNGDGFGQGVKRLYMVTGDRAREAIKATDALESQFADFSSMIKERRDVHLWREKEKHLDTAFSGTSTDLSKITRAQLYLEFDKLRAILRSDLNKILQANFIQAVQEASNAGGHYLIKNYHFSKTSRMVTVLQSCDSAIPVMVFNNEDKNKYRAIVYVPEAKTHLFTAKDWAEHITTSNQARCGAVKNMNSDNFYQIFSNGKQSTDSLLKLATEFVEKQMSPEMTSQ